MTALITTIPITITLVLVLILAFPCLYLTTDERITFNGPHWSFLPD